MSKKRLLNVIILFSLSLLIIWIVSAKMSANRGDSENAKPKTEFGIIVDSLMVQKEKVNLRESLSELLLKYNVDYTTIDKVAQMSENIFNFSKIRVGNKYTVILSDDSIQKLQYFIYEISPIDYIVIDLRDSVHVHKGSKEVEKKIKTVSGTIKSSLWNTLIENNEDPNLAIELSEIYAWTIDFFGIQDGDKYKVVYEELIVEGKPIGIERILASEFTNNNKDYYAIYFVEDSVGSYFDENGNSLKKAFLKAPLKFRRISSKFTHSRLHPILKIRRPHLGVDYSAPYGTPVLSIGNGKVIKAGHSGGAGKMVKIKHNGTYTTAYLHLANFGKGIREGASVSQGDVIGYVGSSGMSTGPHLDFRFYKNGKPVDPLKVVTPPAKPVDKEHLKEFNAQKDTLIKKLNSVVSKPV